VRLGLLLSVLAVLACSAPEARSGAESGRASPDTAATGLQADTLSILPPAEVESAGDQPGVVFRCEEGRLGAYLVTAAAGEGGLYEDQMVPIRLDSAPGC
jgi:hypothetical protein